MKIQRTQNTINGAIWGVIERTASILLPFFVRTVMIKKLGVEYLGLSGLFTSILQVLNLTELGFGSAAVYAMYKPIADDDYETIGAILSYLKKIYRTIAAIMFAVGVALVPLIPKIISGNVPENINVSILYIIYLLNSVISYAFFAYKSSILSALQCNDTINKVGLVTNSTLRIAQIVMMYAMPSYYVYVLLIPLSTLANNFLISYLVDKKYSHYFIKARLNSELKLEIKSKIVPLMSTKLAVVIVNAADTLVISAFLGLADVARYNNYYYIMNSVMGFLIVIYGAMQAGIGNSLVTDSHDKIMKDFEKFCFINNWIVTICTTMLLCLYQPFMTLWLGDAMLLPFGMVILFSVYFYANAIQRIVVIYKDASGIWRQDMLRCYLSSGLNLAVNVITVRYIGLYGVIGSSVVANIVGLPFMTYILYRSVFRESSKKFYLCEIRDLINAIFVSVTCLIVCKFIPQGVIGLLLRGCVCFAVTNICLFVLYRKNAAYLDAKSWVVNLVRSRIHR